MPIFGRRCSTPLMRKLCTILYTELVTQKTCGGVLFMYLYLHSFFMRNLGAIHYNLYKYKTTCIYRRPVFVFTNTRDQHKTEMKWIYYVTKSIISRYEIYFMNEKKNCHYQNLIINKGMNILTA